MKLGTLLLIGVLGLSSVSGVAAGRTGGYASHASRSYLGIDLGDVPEDQLSTLHLDSKIRCAQITQVDHDGPAGKAGLAVHDIVIKVNGVWVAGQDQLRKMLRNMAPGKTVTMTVNRNGQTLDLTAQMADRDEVMKRAWDDHYVVPEPQDAASPPQSSGSLGFFSSHIPFTGPYTGVTLDTMSKQLSQFFGTRDGKGLLIQAVDANSPGANAGLKAGDVVVRVNGRNMESTSDWSHAVRDSKGQKLPVTILRDRKEQTVWILPGGKKHTDFVPLQEVQIVIVTL